MFIKKMMTIVVTFVTSLIILSFLGNMIYWAWSGASLSLDAVLFENLFRLPLFIVGYGDSPMLSVYSQLILSIIGLVMVSFLNAYLTVTLFKSKKVDVKLKIEQKNAKDFTVLTQILNKGSQIYNVSLSLQVYKKNEEGNTKEVGIEDRQTKMINAKGSWTAKHKIATGDFIYDFFRSYIFKREEMGLQAVLEYVDDDNGSTIILAKDFPAEMILENCVKAASAEDKPFSAEEFRAFIEQGDVVIDLHKTQKIVENGDNRAMSIIKSDDENHNMIEVHADFSKKDGFNPPVFVMALIKYFPNENWGYFYEKNYSLEFDLCASHSINAVQLEVKSKYGGGLSMLIDERIEIINETFHYSFNLKNYKESLPHWRELSEICFTCFASQVSSHEVVYKIKDLKLVETDAKNNTKG